LFGGDWVVANVDLSSVIQVAGGCGGRSAA
jgi:hypothetical protein